MEIQRRDGEYFQFHVVESSELSRKRTFEWIHMETVFDDAIEHVEIDDTWGLLAITGKGRIVIYMAKIEGEGQCL